MSYGNTQGEPSKIDQHTHERDGRTISTERTIVYIDAVDNNLITYSVNLTFERLVKVNRLIEVTLESRTAPDNAPVNPGDVCRVFIPRVVNTLNTVGLTICGPHVGITATGGTIHAEVSCLGF